jgi:hypothetical protein
MSGERGRRRLFMVLVFIALAGCGAFKNGPPTDDETLAAFIQCWNENAKPSSFPDTASYPDYLQPVATHLGNDGITQQSAFGTEYSVTISFSYRALRDLQYLCNPADAFSVAIWPAGATFPQDVQGAITARVGDIISCDSGHSYSKIAEGWIFHVNPALSYVIRR